MNFFIAFTYLQKKRVIEDAIKIKKLYLQEKNFENVN